MSEQIGILLKNINNDLGRYSDREAKKMGITQVQMSIIDFVYRNESKQELYQTDVEREFNIQKSSATALLKLMEKKGVDCPITIQN
nr:helix-turn-helix domain-containing protein [Lentilactobacillus otakiensis]